MSEELLGNLHDELVNSAKGYERDLATPAVKTMPSLVRLTQGRLNAYNAMLETFDALDNGLEPSDVWDFLLLSINQHIEFIKNAGPLSGLAEAERAGWESAYRTVSERMVRLMHDWGK